MPDGVEEPSTGRGTVVFSAPCRKPGNLPVDHLNPRRWTSSPGRRGIKLVMWRVFGPATSPWRLLGGGRPWTARRADCARRCPRRGRHAGMSPPRTPQDRRAHLDHRPPPAELARQHRTRLRPLRGWAELFIARRCKVRATPRRRLRPRFASSPAEWRGARGTRRHRSRRGRTDRPAHTRGSAWGRGCPAFCTVARASATIPQITRPQNTSIGMTMSQGHQPPPWLNHHITAASSLDSSLRAIQASGIHDRSDRPKVTGGTGRMDQSHRRWLLPLSTCRSTMTWIRRASNARLGWLDGAYDVTS